MELKNFVYTAIVDIVEGVAEAKKFCASQGAQLNPSGLRYNLKDIGEKGYTEDGQVAQMMIFDVSLTTEEGEQSKGGIGVASIFMAGAGYQADNAEKDISRVQFSVPIIFP